MKRQMIFLKGGQSGEDNTSMKQKNIIKKEEWGSMGPIHLN
jgi:hypothetical protein